MIPENCISKEYSDERYPENNLINCFDKVLYVDSFCANFFIIMTYIILFLLALIVYNLIAGFIYILKDKSKSNRGFYSLRTRIILSLLLFFFLIIGYYLNLIQPHSI